MDTSKYRGTKALSQLALLEEVILLLQSEHGRIPISNANGGFKVITIDGTAKDLSDGGAIPTEAGSATIMVEANSGVTKLDRCVRFTENDTPPTETAGFFLGDADWYEVSGDALNDISFISGESGQTATLFVQFNQSTETDK